MLSTKLAHMAKITTIIVIFCFLILKANGTSRNNVCKRALDYMAIEKNRNCWYNPDVGANIEEIIARYGYPFEAYSVTTKDGYILNLIRIPHDNVNTHQKRQPVLVMHGIFMSSLFFVLIGNRSLPFFLSNNGFDVWLLNSRGSALSGGHVTLPATPSSKFWDFSFHESGLYDIPAAVDFVRTKTAADAGKIIFIGYSMGTSASFVYSILRRDHASENLQSVIALAPIAYFINAKGLVPFVAQYQDLLKLIIVRIFHIYAIFTNDNPTTWLTHFLLVKVPIVFYLGIIGNFMGSGPDLKETQARDMTMLFSVTPSSTSIKTIVHYAQWMKKGAKFQYYDYGREENLKRYNSSKPLVYDASRINVPMYLFYGTNDFVSTKEGNQKLFEELTVKTKEIIPIDPLNHVSYFIAKDAETLLYKPLLRVMKSNK